MMHSKSSGFQRNIVKPKLKEIALANHKRHNVGNPNEPIRIQRKYIVRVGGTPGGGVGGTAI